MENKNTGLKVLIIILTLLVVALSGYIIYDKSLSDDNNVNNDVNNNSMEEINYENMKGAYKTTQSVTIDGQNQDIPFILYLWENGTFKYEEIYNVSSGYIGNYIIKDNKLILNYLFSTGTDVSLTVTNGSKEITINKDKTLSTNSNHNYDNNKPISITMTKSNDSYDNIYQDNNYIYNMINGYYINNAIPNQ